MAKFEQSIDVNVPVRTAYNQWTQFESFPLFMESVEEVRQIDDRHLRWRANVAGKIEEWEAEIDEQHADERIAWHATGGVRQAGVVTFHYLEPNKTRVMLQLEYEPGNVIEKAGTAMGLVNSEIKGDLARFKEFIEARGQETGGWRGEIEDPGH